MVLLINSKIVVENFEEFNVLDGFLNIKFQDIFATKEFCDKLKDIDFELIGNNFIKLKFKSLSFYK